MHKALITGSTGFVGTNLIHYLNGKVDVFTINRQDLLNITHQDMHDSIIHLAGKAHDLKNASDVTEYIHVNFEITKKIYDAFLKSTASKFIFISSVKASADSLTKILTEDDNPAPGTPYGKSKLMAEEYIRSQPLPEGKSFFILRPCMIHGPGNKGNLNLLYKFIASGLPYPLAAFENKRSFLSIENLCFVINELIKCDDIPSGTYNVADDEALSTNEVISLICSSSGLKSSLWRISPTLIQIIAKFGDRLHLPLTTERLIKLTENYVVCTMKLKAALKKEMPVESRDGIANTIKSFSSKLK